MVPVTSADETTSTRWWRPLGSPDRRAIAWLVVIPIVLFVVPALAGHPAIDADNLIQNFPLRVLVGRQLASGHLPLLNPLANSGTPLLGGMNAGAFYPLTLIFVVVPAIAAWVVNLIAVYVTAALGVYALARWHGLRASSALVAALSFTYFGAMMGQLVHLGVVQGYALMPWVLLVLLAFARRLTGLAPDASTGALARVSLAWGVGLAALFALTCLTGEPRAISVVELLIVVGVPAVLLLRSSYQPRTWRTRVAYLVTLAVGVAWGAGLALVQLLPGWSFIRFSQRAHISYSYFGAGSLAVRWTTLLLNPDLLGGNGALHQQGFFANYNLPEVTGYAGLVALMALFAFLTRLTRRGWRGGDRDYAIYVVVLVVGLFAAWGSFTPLGHLFHELPLFGSTRLQSRNIIFVDLALSALLGWWLEHLQSGREERAGLGPVARWITLVPVVLAAALSAALMLGGRSALDALVSLSSGRGYLERQMDLLNAIHLALALAVVAVVWFFRRSPKLFALLVALLVVDLVVFNVFSDTAIVGGDGPTEPSHAVAAKALGTQGRFALIDSGGAHTNEYRVLGEPNMNVFTRLASVQGYGSLISDVYDDSTGTHPTNGLSACHLWEGTFVQLRLSSIAIASQLLARHGGLSTPVPTKCRPLEPTTSVERYFGTRWSVGTVTLVAPGSARLSGRTLRLQLLNAEGQRVGPVLRAPSAHEATFELDGARGAGFVVTSSARVALNDTVVTTEGDASASYQLDSNFQLALASLPFHLHAVEGTFALFRTSVLLPKAWVATPSSGRVTSIRGSSWGETWVKVDLSRRADLKRSEAYLPGWRATAVSETTGRRVALSVRRVGLIQFVSVPAGRWTVVFNYHAPYITAGVVGSALSLAALLVVLAYEARRRRTGRARVRA